MADHLEMVIVFTGTLLLAYILCHELCKQIRHRSLSFPPTLTALPLIGSVFSLPKFTDIHVTCLKEVKTYGRVFGFYIGSRYALFLQSREAIHEAFVTRSLDFANRGSGFIKEAFKMGNHGIINRSYDQAFRHTRFGSLSILRQFGFGKGIMETRINLEVDELISWIKELRGQAFSPDNLIARCVMNVISSIAFGRRFPREHAKRDAFISDVYKFARGLLVAIPINSIPVLRFVPGLRGRFLGLCETHERLIAFIEDNVRESLADDANISFSNSFRDAEKEFFDPKELCYVVRDLVVAGTETSITTIRWAILTFANHPDIQIRMQKEIDEVVPRSRLPSLNDRPNLPYVDAAIHELLRCYTVVSMAIPHYTACDTEVCGYFVPARTMVFASLYAIHMDPQLWPEPTAFNPERFLDEDGKLTGKDRIIPFGLGFASLYAIHVDPELWPEPTVFKPERFLDEDGKLVGTDRIIPFGLGRRSCLDELLARQEMFLFISGLLQQFEIRPPEGKQHIDFEVLSGLTLSPSEFCVRFIERN